MNEPGRLRAEVEELKGGMYALIDVLDNLAERLDASEEKLKLLLSSAKLLKSHSTKITRPDSEYA